MDFLVMKDEKSVGRRQICMVDGADQSMVAACVKRRKREPAAAAAGDDQTKQQKMDRTSCKSNVKRSSKFRGVSRHRWTGRYEAHLWDKLSWNVTQRKKGKQVYLGAYDDETAAARAFDLAAIKYWGTSTFTNFPISDYEKEIEIMQTMTKEEYLASLRRKSSGFSRGVSKYRGVARHHQNGRWEARIGRVFGNKYLYLGTYGTQEEAARAYDIAAIEYRGVHAMTNFDLSTYLRYLKPAGENTTTDAYKTVTEEPQKFPTLTEFFPIVSQPSLFHGDSFDPDCLSVPQKQDVFQNTAPLSSRKKSSPTALGLLLRSSVFRELVKKNPNGAEEATDSRYTKNQNLNTTGDDAIRDIFYEGTEDTLFVCDTDGMELQEKEILFSGMDHLNKNKTHTTYDFPDIIVEEASIFPFQATGGVRA